MKSCRLPSILIVVCIVLTPTFSKAQQSNYTKGYAITVQGDSIPGFINWKKNFNISDLVQLKKSTSEKPTNYAWADINKLVNTEDNKTIIAIEAEINFEYVNKFDLNIIINDDSIRKADIPLTPLYIGKVYSLFKYHDKVDYFFIEFNGETQQLLREYTYLTEYEKLEHRDRIYPAFWSYDTWKVQLYSLYDFNADKKLYNQSLEAKFDEFDLFKLVSKMDKNQQKKDEGHN
jgi:uncharacterized protein (UPF0333 family)